MKKKKKKLITPKAYCNLCGREDFRSNLKRPENKQLRETLSLLCGDCVIIVDRIYGQKDSLVKQINGFYWEMVQKIGKERRMVK